MNNDLDKKISNKKIISSNQNSTSTIDKRTNISLSEVKSHSWKPSWLSEDWGYYDCMCGAELRITSEVHLVLGSSDPWCPHTKEEHLCHDILT